MKHTHSDVERGNQRLLHEEDSQWITLNQGYYLLTIEKWMLPEGSKNILSLSDVHGPSQDMSYDIRAI